MRGGVGTRSVLRVRRETTWVGLMVRGRERWAYEYDAEGGAVGSTVGSTEGVQDLQQ